MLMAQGYTSMQLQFNSKTNEAATAEGLEFKHCERCDYEETRTLEILPHNRQYVSGKSPTCMERGYAPYEYCTDCAYSTYQEIPQLEHEYEWETLQEEQPDQPGLREQRCVHCGAVGAIETILPSSGGQSTATVLFVIGLVGVTGGGIGWLIWRKKRKFKK